MAPQLPTKPPNSQVGGLTQQPLEPSSSAPRSGRRREKKGKQRQRDDGNGGDSGDEGNDGSGKRDGYRHLEVENMPVLFECPFHKSDMVRYHDCKGYPRFCDLMQHIKRRHFMREDRYYCTRCRIEFTQDNPAASQDRHTRDGTCSIATTEKSGVMLPDEYDALKKHLDKMGSNVSSERKWDYLWCQIFDSNPPSPYVENMVVAIQSANRRRADNSLTPTLYSIFWELFGHGDDAQIEFAKQRILDSIFQEPTTVNWDPFSLETRQYSASMPDPGRHHSGHPQLLNDMQSYDLSLQNDLTGLDFPHPDPTMSNGPHSSGPWPPNNNATSRRL
ncbi:hypothetical protein ACHAPT_011201 [Fusarium lateritium]